jgi:hypothetical protein
MNLHPRIDSINGALQGEYMTAITTGLEPFEQLLDEIETGIARYREDRR